MFPLYDDKKIIFWSYKSGCTFIRENYYNHYVQLNYTKNYIKILTLFNRFKKIDKNKLLTYKKIYICRNPYSRIVSCFIDKYIKGYFTSWLKLNIKIINFFNYFQNKNYIKFNFEEFINLVYDKIVLNKFNFVEFDHISPQFNIIVSPF